MSSLAAGPATSCGRRSSTPAGRGTAPARRLSKLSAVRTWRAPLHENVLQRDTQVCQFTPRPSVSIADSHVAMCRVDWHTDRPVDWHTCVQRCDGSRLRRFLPWSPNSSAPHSSDSPQRRFRSKRICAAGLPRSPSWACRMRPCRSHVSACARACPTRGSGSRGVASSSTWRPRICARRGHSTTAHRAVAARRRPTSCDARPSSGVGAVGELALDGSHPAGDGIARDGRARGALRLEVPAGAGGQRRGGRAWCAASRSCRSTGCVTRSTCWRGAPRSLAPTLDPDRVLAAVIRNRVPDLGGRPRAGRGAAGARGGCRGWPQPVDDRPARARQDDARAPTAGDPAADRCR